MSVNEYSVKFTQLSKYVTNLEVNPNTKINKFFMGFIGFVEKKCRKEMLLNDMDISKIMVYAQ